MARFTRDPEKAAERERKRAERAAAADAARDQQHRAREEAAFWASAQGQARLAAQTGQPLYQIALPLMSTQRTFAGIISGDKQGVKVTSGEHTDVLSSIESEGWRLEQAGYVFQQTGSVSRDKMLSTGQTASVTGDIWGIYIFRRLPE